MESRASRDFQAINALADRFCTSPPHTTVKLEVRVRCLSARCMHITDNIEETSMIVENMTVSELRDLAIGHT